MTEEELLAAYDQQVRRTPAPLTGFQVELVPDPAPMLLLIPESDASWGGGVFWCDLTDATADAAIAHAIERFRPLGREWEWKHFDYDAPKDLPERLAAAGFTADEAETLLIGEVGDVCDLLGDAQPPAGVSLRRVEHGHVADDDWAGMARLNHLVWGESGEGMLRSVRAEYDANPDDMSVWVAVAEGGTVVCAARIEFTAGTQFSSLWGGATHPDFRGRGIYKALVAVRARQARERGFRFLQVDASDDSRPILQRLGMRRVATTTPWQWSPTGVGRDR